MRWPGFNPPRGQPWKKFYMGGFSFTFFLIPLASTLKVWWVFSLYSTFHSNPFERGVLLISKLPMNMTQFLNGCCIIISILLFTFKTLPMSMQTKFFCPSISKSPFNNTTQHSLLRLTDEVCQPKRLPNCHHPSGLHVSKFRHWHRKQNVVKFDIGKE